MITSYRPQPEGLPMGEASRQCITLFVHLRAAAHCRAFVLESQTDTLIPEQHCLTHLGFGIACKTKHNSLHLLHWLFCADGTSFIHFRGKIVGCCIVSVLNIRLPSGCEVDDVKQCLCELRLPLCQTC